VVYLLREAAKITDQHEVYIPIKLLRDVIFKELPEKDNIVIYPSEAELNEDIKTLQKLSFFAVKGDKIVINRESFLSATSKDRKNCLKTMHMRQPYLKNLNKEPPNSSNKNQLSKHDLFRILGDFLWQNLNGASLQRAVLRRKQEMALFNVDT
jgi:hypothetical protein